MDHEKKLLPNRKEFELHELLHVQPALKGTALLTEAGEFFKTMANSFAAVEEGGRVLGICSRSKIGELLGSQFGYALYSRSIVKDFLEEESLVVGIGESIEAILAKAFGRDELNYWKDVVVCGIDGGYLGLLKATSLVRWQSELVKEKIESLEAQKQELRVAGDTLKQTNHELEVARDAGLQAARAKSEFLAVMSHEIRTPLNGVIGMLTLLADSRLDANQSELLITASQSAEALLLILNDILDFSRLESGRVEIESLRFDVRELVESVMTLMLESAHESGLEVICDVEPSVPASIVSDCGRLRQILSNFLGNAVKFTKEGRIRLGVRHEIEAEGRVLRFEVEDTGIGISSEEQGRLFQPFVQADSSTTRRFGGTGLGLAICSELVKAMGGSLGLESEPGVGSRFWFSVPDRSIAGTADVYPARQCPFELVALVFVRKRSVALQIEKELLCRNIVSLLVSEEEVFHELVHHTRSGLDLVVCQVELISDVDRKALACAPTVWIHASHGNGVGDTSGRKQTSLYLPVRPRMLGRCVERVLGLDGEDRLEEAVDFRDPEGESADKATLRVLLVEDNAINRRLASHLVVRLGYQCEQAEDGVEALEICSKESFDVILLDCRMPRMDGYEFARIFREREAEGNGLPRTPIVALTANAMQGDRERCLQAGMDEYLTKPLRKPALKSILDSIALTRSQSIEI